MRALLLNCIGATVAAWLFLWRLLGDRWGLLGMLNAWAEWGLLLLGTLGLQRLTSGDRKAGIAMLGAAAWVAVPSLRNSYKPPIPQPSPGGAQSFTIFSANLFKRNRSLATHLALIRRTDPDIICLQELTPSFCDEVLAVIGEAYPYRALRPAKGSYGFAVLSRFPLIESGFWDRPGVNPWGQRVQITLPGGELIDLYNVHLFPPMADSAFTRGVTWSFRAREGQLKVIQAEIIKHRKPAVIIGDHNFSDLSDAYRLATLMWKDSWREAGRGVRYTWPQRAFPNKWIPANPRMLRLDYCFHTPDLQTRAIKVISDRTGSDHTPLLVDLAMTSPSPLSSEEYPGAHALKHSSPLR